MFPRVTLVVVEGAHAGKKQTFNNRPAITIGRGDECTFPLHGQTEDLLVSRRHCVIGVGTQGVAVRDLESRNGTFVNGMRLGLPLGEGHDPSVGFRAPLQDGDQIRVGTSLLEVRIEGGPAAREATDQTEYFND
jgi:eukaryotic-like serine/threonine-protein kinase